MTPEAAEIISVMKAAAWARAKGVLGEVVALQGSRISDSYRLNKLQDKIDAFIDSIEDAGLHE